MFIHHKHQLLWSLDCITQHIASLHRCVSCDHIELKRQLRHIEDLCRRFSDEVTLLKPQMPNERWMVCVKPVDDTTCCVQIVRQVEEADTSTVESTEGRVTATESSQRRPQGRFFKTPDIKRNKQE